MAVDNFSADLETQVGEIRDALRQVDALFGQLRTSVKGHLDNVTETASASFKDLTKEINGFSTLLQKDISSSLRNAIKGGNDFANVFEKMRSSLEDLVIQLAVINPVLNGLFGGQRGTLGDMASFTRGNFGGDRGIFGSLLGGIFDLFEGRAAGGPVRAGIPYIVGERGPELFVPPTAGRIATSAGGAPISITMNISTSDANSFRASQAQVAAAVLDSVRRAQRIR
jgi:hypothetical protein